MFPDETHNGVGLADGNSSAVPTVNGLTDNCSANEVNDHPFVATAEVDNSFTKEDGFVKVKGRKKQGKNRSNPSSNLQRERNEAFRYRRNKQKTLSPPVSLTTERNLASVSSSRIRSNLKPEMNDVGAKCIKDKEETSSSPISQTTDKNFVPVSSGRTYSSVLRNRCEPVTTNGQSRIEKNSSVISRDTCNVSEDIALDKFLNNCESPVSSETDLPTKDDVSAPVNNCFQNEQISHEYNPNKYSDVAEESESSNPAYCESVVSNDSGRGDSEITYDQKVPYMCEFPKNKIAQLIGRNGKYRNKIQIMSGIHFFVKHQDHPTNPDMCIIEMYGTGAQINRAKEIIMGRFPNVSLKQYIQEPFVPLLTQHFFLNLPACSVFVVVSSIYNPHFFWVQQYGHPNYHKLQDLEKSMTDHFNTATDVPAVLNPQTGSVVAVQGLKYGDNARWTRGEVIDILPEEESVVIRYLDHGGDFLVPVTNIRPMRNEFFNIPFFASQCCLYDIRPTGDRWSNEALEEFTRLCNGKTFPPTLQVVGKDGMCYLVSMKAQDSETGKLVDVATHLVAKGFGFRPSLPAAEFPPHLSAAKCPPTLPAAEVPPTLPAAEVPPTLPAAEFPPTLPAAEFPPTLQAAEFPPTLQATEFPPESQL